MVHSFGTQHVLEHVQKCLDGRRGRRYGQNVRFEHVQRRPQMSYVVGSYLFYVAVSLALTFWVARALSRSGWVFLADVFDGNPDLAEAVNRLLVVGFYLINVGFILLALKTTRDLLTFRSVLELLSMKL